MDYNRFPPAMMKPLSRDPVDCELPLLHHEPGAKKEKLWGYYINVTPVGTREDVDVSPPACFLAGDGMVCRLKLAPGKIELKSALVKDPTFVGHDILFDDRKLAKPKFDTVSYFRRFGVAIVSWPYIMLENTGGGLGSRVLSNVSVHTIGLGDDPTNAQPLLLVTTDAGRPVVFDPVAMKTVGVLGTAQEWRGALLTAAPFPFVNTTAHPAFDSRTGELYNINFARDMVAEVVGVLTGKSDAEVRRAADCGEPLCGTTPTSVSAYLFALLGEQLLRWQEGVPAQRSRGGLHDCGDGVTSFFDEGRGIHYVSCALDCLPEPLRSICEESGACERYVLAIPEALANLLLMPFRGAITVLRRIVTVVKQLFGDMAMSFTNVMRWDARQAEYGSTGPDVPLDSFPVVDVTGNPVRIIDSAHQMGITKDWVVFADTQFKFSLTIVLSDFLAQLPASVERLLRRWLTRKQRSECEVYFVSRQALRERAAGEAVTASVVVLPAEVVHYLVDYEHTDEGYVVLTAAHQRAMDGAEFIARSDLDANNREVNSDIVGMFPAALDVNDVTRYQIDLSVPERPEIRAEHPLVDAEYTWVVGLPCGPGIGLWEPGRPTPPDRIDWTAWYNEGFLPELLTRQVYRLYRDYRGRRLGHRGGARVSLEEIRQLVSDGGAPGGFFKAIVEPDGLTLGTTHKLAHGVQITSPQYVPPHPDEPDHPGFIVACVFRAEPQGDKEREREVWVFRADDFAKPLLRFDAGAANWQYTLHTQWIADLPDGEATSSTLKAQRDAFPPSVVPPGSKLEELITAIYADPALV